MYIKGWFEIGAECASNGTTLQEYEAMLKAFAEEALVKYGKPNTRLTWKLTYEQRYSFMEGYNARQASLKREANSSTAI